MTQEQLRMQMLAGIITESEYKAKVNEVSDEHYLVKNNKGDIIGSWNPSHVKGKKFLPNDQGKKEGFKEDDKLPNGAIKGDAIKGKTIERRPDIEESEYKTK